jgi:CBS domain containing-hemolysin-like protein
VNDPVTSAPEPWLVAGILLVVLYRAAMAALLEAFHALPSIQRRRLLEEDGVPDPLLARLLERPHALGLGLTLWNQTLLVLLLGLVWPTRACVPGGGWTLVALTLLYVWALDLVIPTLLTAREPGQWVVRLFPAYGLVHRLLAPLVAPLAHFVEREREQHDLAREAEDEETSDDGVNALLEEGEAEGILEEEDRELIRNVVSFGDTVVREVMTPRTLIHGIPCNATLEETWELFRTSRHSRMPVFNGSVDTIRGVLLLKDLMQLTLGEPLDMAALLKPACFVPESKNILELLRELQRDRTQLAVVVDEYGSLSGLVTLEDLLEEIFGEIHDEHELQAEFQEVAPGEFLVSGQMHVEDLEHHLDRTFERNGFDTIGGLVMATLGHMPRPQESVAVDGVILTVHKMEGRRILLVHVKVTPASAG